MKICAECGKKCKPELALRARLRRWRGHGPSWFCCRRHMEDYVNRGNPRKGWDGVEHGLLERVRERLPE